MEEKYRTNVPHIVATSVSSYSLLSKLDRQDYSVPICLYMCVGDKSEPHQSDSLSLNIAV